MQIGTLVFDKNSSLVKEGKCIKAEGQWLTKEYYPELFHIFSGCKCEKPEELLLDGIINEHANPSHYFHLPKSIEGIDAWIVKDSL